MITIARKDRVVRRIDERNDNLITGGGDLVQIGSAAVTAPGVLQPPPPEDVTIGTQVLLRTTYTPKVAVNVSWGAPANLLPEFYLVEYAEDDAFTTNVIRVTTSLNRIALEMKPDTDYWVRVKAMIRGIYSEWGYPSNYPSVSVHTLDDDTPPGAVTGVTANWSTGDLILKWTNPSSQNFFQTRVRIYNTFGGTLFKEVFVVGNPGSKSEYRFTVDENYDVTAGNPLTTVYYEILALSLAGVPALSAVTGTITKAKPTIPTGLSSSWSGDDGTYDETVTITWNAVTGASTYRVIVDGSIKETPRTQYTYTYSENVNDHRPTLVSGDYALAFTVQAKDALNQISPGASGTATNLAPQASNLALTTVPGFSSLYAYITPTTEILDLYGYNWTLKSGGVNVRHVTSFTPEITFTTLNGAYVLEVAAIDKFGRASATISGAVILDGLTIEQLRAETQYTNSLGTNPTTLAGLKNNNLVQSVVTIPSGTTWQWHKTERPLLDRYRTITVAFSGAATNMPRIYFGASADDSTYVYFSGPLVATGATGVSTTLTEYGSEASAQSNAVLVTNINRFDLPAITEARFVKMGHRGNIHHLAEYYPRRIIQSDDIEAETIKGINILAQTITADKIQVFSLAASTATISGVLSIATTGGIYQGTGSFSSPITGLKIYNSSGVGTIALYSGGLAQVFTNTNGQLSAGLGAVTLDSEGISIQADSIVGDVNTIKWTSGTGGSGIGIASIYGLYTEPDADLWLLVNAPSTGVADMHLQTQAFGSNKTSTITFSAQSISYNDVDLVLAALPGGTGGATLSIGDTSAFRIQFSAADVFSVTGLGVVTADNAIISDAQGVRSLGTNAGLTFEDRTSSIDWQWYASADAARLYDGSRDVFQVDTGLNGVVNILHSSATTNTAPRAFQLFHNTSGTATTNFGISISLTLESSTGSLREAALIQGVWSDAVDTTRNGDLRFFGSDGNGATNNLREFFRGSSTGSAGAIGFFGTGAVGRQTVTGAKGGNAALGSLLTALAAYGLITDSSTA